MTTTLLNFRLVTWLSSGVETPPGIMANASGILPIHPHGCGKFRNTCIVSCQRTLKAQDSHRASLEINFKPSSVFLKTNLSPMAAKSIPWPMSAIILSFLFLIDSK